MLNLCFVADASSIHVQRWLGYFAQAGHRVTCLSDKPGDAGDGILTIRLPSRDSLSIVDQPCHKRAVLLARTHAIQQHLQAHPPDLLHAHFVYQRGWSAAATGFHPLVITVYGSDIYLQNLEDRRVFQRWRDEWHNRRALTQADWVTGMSQDLCLQASRLGARPVSWVPLGIDVATFSTPLTSEVVAAFRRRLDLPNNAWVVLSPRQMTPLYQIDLIVEGFAQFYARHPDSYLLLKDTGTQDDDRLLYRERIKVLTEQLGISHVVRWMGAMAHDQLPLIYQSVQVTVMAPKTDGLPVTMLESMACGTPVLAPDHKGYDGILLHGHTGWRFPQLTANAIMEALAHLKKNRTLASQWSNNVKPILQKHGDFTSGMEQVEQQYQRLCKGFNGE